MDVRLGIVLGASLLLAAAQLGSRVESDHFCATFADANEPCGCTLSRIAAYDPTCGSDGVTYLSECYLQCRNVMQNGEMNVITVKHSGACSKECTCKCSGVYSPMCGTDNTTYSNICTLECASAKNTSIGFRHDGQCGKYQDLMNIRSGSKRSGTIKHEELGPFPSPAILRTDCRNKKEKRVLRQKNKKNKSKGKRNITKLLDPITSPDGNYIIHTLLTDSEQRELEGEEQEERNKIKEKCVCAALYRPVCGDNGKSYINFCVLFCVNKIGEKANFAHWGKCKKKE